MKNYLLLLCLAAGFAAHGQTDTAKQEKNPSGNKMVEQMPQPLFDMGTYLSRNIVYPVHAREIDMQGRVLVKFVVNEDGSISDVKVIKGIGGGCDEEAERVVKAMPKWRPGMQDGKPVKVYFTMPIVFKLRGLKSFEGSVHAQIDTEDHPKVKLHKGRKDVYDYVEEMPQPSVNISEYLSKNIVYPDYAKNNSIEGEVITQFIVNENGRVTDVVIKKGIGGGCDEEAWDVVKSMPAWKPGMQDGKPVKVFFTLPIDFKLTDPTPTNTN